MPPAETVVEAFRVPADPRSPGVVRRRIADLLAGAEWADAGDTVLLLVSELVTNGVVHAGTDVTVSVWMSAPFVTVAVRDDNPAPVPVGNGARDPDDLLTESGRGLPLVFRLATAWGVTHQGEQKTVWFTVGGPGSGPSGPPGPAADAPPVVDLAPARRRRPLRLAMDPRMGDELTLTEQVGELVAGLLDALDADGGRVRLDDAAGEVVIERGATAPAASTIELPLTAAGRQVGRLQVYDRRPETFTLEDRGLAQLAAARIALAVRSAELSAAEARRSGWTAFLAEASDLLAGSLDMQRTLVLLCQLAVSRLARAAAVYLTERGGGLRLVSCAHADEAELASLRRRLSAPGAAPTGTDEVTTTFEGGETRLAVALRARGHELGRLVLMRPGSQPFQAEELGIIRDLARRAALAVDNARLFEEQLQVARALQDRLLPPVLPADAPLEFGACYHAARSGVDVGGDFYDVTGGGDDWVVAIGDVCGKGAEAAAVTGVVRDGLRLLLRQGRSLSHALRALNETLVQTGGAGRFCTVAAAQLRRGPGNAWTGRLCVAGHPLPLLLHPDGGVDLVGQAGTLLGVLPDPDVSLVEATVTLAPGDALVFYTDGVTDRQRAGELFGDTGLAAVLRGCGGLTAAAVAARVDQATATFTDEPLRDDMAVLVLRAPLTPLRPGLVPAAGVGLTR